jgi:hypothetical protein
MFGRKDKEKMKALEAEIAYLKGKLEAISQQREKELIELLQKKPQPEDDFEPPQNPQQGVNRAMRKLDKISWALIEKRIQALEKRLHSPLMEQSQTQTAHEQTTLDNIDGDNVDIRGLLSNPMIRTAINIFLRRYNTSIDDLASDPSKLITLLENLTTELKSRKQEAESKGQSFNPYDPTLFMKR